MKRLLALTSLSLAAVFMVTSPADGQTAAPRASTENVTATTTPQRARTRPYTFTTRGTVVAPPNCAAGTPSDGTCVPFLCPFGVTDPAYCVAPPVAILCSGSVSVTFKILIADSSITISSRNVDLAPDCTYRSRVRFRSRTRRRATLQVFVRFEGNDLLLPRSAATDTVRIG